MKLFLQAVPRDGTLVVEFFALMAPPSQELEPPANPGVQGSCRHRRQQIGGGQ
jgi:hypothetical protein